MPDCLPIASGGFQRRDEPSLLGSLARAMPGRRRKSKALATLETVEVSPHARHASVTRRAAIPAGPLTLMQIVILRYLENVPADYDGEDAFPPRPVDVAV
jgi:hypothetical protein